MKPQARTEELLIQRLPEEVLVYDQRTFRVYCLSRAVAIIWESCDGKRNTEELAQIVEKELNIPADNALVELALENLADSDLLVAPIRTPRVNRRAAMIQFAALVAISSLTAPTPAHAGSGGIPPSVISSP